MSNLRTLEVASRILPRPSFADADPTKAASAASAATPDELLRLSDVLRTLPPDFVRHRIWLRLSRAERTALMLTCRDLRALAGSFWVPTLHLNIALAQVGASPIAMAQHKAATTDILLPHFSPPNTTTKMTFVSAAAAVAAPTAAVATATAARADQGGQNAALLTDAPSPLLWRRTLHDTYTGTRSVTLRLCSSPANVLYGNCSAGTAAVRTLRQLNPSSMTVMHGSDKSIATPQSIPGAHPSVQMSYDELQDAGVLQHFNIVRRELATTDVIRNTPTTTYAVRDCTAGAGTSLDAASSGSDSDGGDGGGGGGDGYADSGGGDLFSVERDLFAHLGVCNNVRTVRVLGLPYDLALRKCFLAPLAAVYPGTEELFLRCTNLGMTLQPIPIPAKPATDHLPVTATGCAAAHSTATAAAMTATADEASLATGRLDAPALATLFPHLHHLELSFIGVVDQTANPDAAAFDGEIAPPAYELEAAAAAAATLPRLLARPPPLLRSLHLSGLMLTEDVMEAILRLVVLEDLGLRIVRPSSYWLLVNRRRLTDSAALAAASDFGKMASLLGQLTLLLRLRHIAVGLLTDTGALIPDSAAATVKSVEPLTSRAVRLQEWASLFRPGAVGEILTSLELRQLMLEGPLLQAIQRCPNLTALTALGLGKGHGRLTGTFRAGRNAEERLCDVSAMGEDDDKGRVLWKLRRLRLADVRLGRTLLDVLHTAPELQNLTLGLSLAQFQVQNARGGVRGGSDNPNDSLPGEEWRRRFDLAAASAAVLVTEAATAAAAAKAPLLSPWAELLCVCSRCTEVQLMLRGSLVWSEVVGWVAGALGPRLTLLGVEASGAYGKHPVRDGDLAAIAYGLPYLRRLHLLSYDVSERGLLQLASMLALQDLRFDSETFLAYIPAEHVLELAVAAAIARQTVGRANASSSSTITTTNTTTTNNNNDSYNSAVGDKNCDFYMYGCCGLDSGQPPRQPPPLVITATFLSERQAEEVNCQLDARVRSPGPDGDKICGSVWMGRGAAAETWAMQSATCARRLDSHGSEGVGYGDGGNYAEGPPVRVVRKSPPHTLEDPDEWLAGNK